MKPESYHAWREKPTSVVAPDWRAPEGDVPRRRGLVGICLTALGFGRRRPSNWIKGL